MKPVLQRKRKDSPVPTIEEINREPEFYALNISGDEFESVYSAEIYSESIDFPM